MAERIVFVDWIKTICIFCVVISHMPIPETWSIYIGSFHVPALFIVSGFLYKEKTVIQIFKSLYIPVLIVSLVNLILFSIYNKDFLWTVFHLDYLFYINKDSDQRAFVGYWFIETLLVIRLSLKVPVLRRYYGVLGFICFILITILYYCKYHSAFILQSQKIVSCFPFFSFGLWLQNKKIKMDYPIYKMGILFLIYVLLVYINGNVGICSGKYGLCYPLTFLNAIVATYLIAALGHAMKKNEFVQTISQGTILILGMHWTFYYFLLTLTPGKLYGYIAIPYGILIVFICFFIIKRILCVCPWVLGRTIRA